MYGISRSTAQETPMVHVLPLCYLSCVMKKPAFCICENKDADQLRGNREADQRLCFRYTDSTIPLLSKSEISSLDSYLQWLYSPVCVGPGRKPRRPVFSQRGSYECMQVVDKALCKSQYHLNTYHNTCSLPKVIIFHAWKIRLLIK